MADDVATPHRGWLDSLTVYAKPRLIAMLLLGFCAGLPFYLVFGVLSAWLREAGVSRTEIGFFVWVGLFYTLKFVWAPVVDRLRVPGFHALLGQRRSWILLAQAGLAVGMIGAGFSEPNSSLVQLALFILLIGFSSATQDIAVDAWRIEAVGDDIQASMAAMYQFGYRAGLMVAQTGALAVAGFLSPNAADGGEIYTPSAWSAAYWTMAAIIILASSTVWWAGEPARMKMGESQWPRVADWPRNLAIGAGSVVAAVIIVLVILRVLAAGLGPLAAGFTVAAKAVAAVHPILAVLVGAALAAPLLRATIIPRGAVVAYALVVLVAAYVLLFRLAYAAWGLFGAQPAAETFALLTLPVYFAVLPFALATALVPIANGLSASSQWLEHPATGPALDFFRRFAWAALLVFAFIATYRISDFTMGVMAKPLYIDLGYLKEAIAGVAGPFGLATLMFGAFAGGAVSLRFGLKTALLVGAVMTVVTNLSFSWLAAHDASQIWRIFVTVGSDNFAGGFAGGVLIAYMSSLTNTAFTATQYAIFSSLYAIYGKLLAGFSGVLADQVGYVWFFAITAGFGIPAILLSLVLFRFDPSEHAAKLARAAPSPA